MRSRSGLSTILTAMLLAVLCVASVRAARRIRPDASHFGIVAFDLNEPVPAKLAALGVGVVRGSCNWWGLEPAPGAFDWRCSDNVIVGAQRQGLRSYMTVTCAPAWSTGAFDCGALPRDMTDWYDFVRHFVARYRQYDVVLGVWNEPNLALRDDPSGAIYAQMFINASNARNSVDPRFVLAGPEVSHHAIAAGYYARVMDVIQSWNALNPWDVVAVHWYRDGPPLTQFLDAVHAAAERHDVWLSETGYSTPDARAQADFYREMLDAFATSRRPWWTHLIFYRLWDGGDCCTESILTGDYRAKPAFDALHQWLDSALDESKDPRPPR